MQMHPRGRRTRQLWWTNGLRAQSPPPCSRLQPLTAAPLRRLLVLAVRRWPRHADAVPVCSGLLACLAVCRVASTKARAANCTTTVETRARRRRRCSPYTCYVLYAGAHSCRQSRVSASQRCPSASLPLRRNKATGVSAAEAMEHCCARSHWPTPVMESSTRTLTHRRFSAMQALLGSKVLEVAKVALPTGSTAATP
jgi:hypothetical protein